MSGTSSLALSSDPVHHPWTPLFAVDALPQRQTPASKTARPRVYRSAPGLTGVSYLLKGAISPVDNTVSLAYVIISLGVVKKACMIASKNHAKQGLLPLLRCRSCRLWAKTAEEFRYCLADHGDSEMKRRLCRRFRPIARLDGAKSPTSLLRRGVARGLQLQARPVAGLKSPLV